MHRYSVAMRLSQDDLDLENAARQSGRADDYDSVACDVGNAVEYCLDAVVGNTMGVLAFAVIANAEVRESFREGKLREAENVLVEAARKFVVAQAENDAEKWGGHA